MLPLVNGTQEQIHDQIFSEVSYHAAYEPMRSLRTPRYCYIRRFGSRRRPMLSNCDPSPTKDEWLRHGYSERNWPDEMLFDLFYDPQEMNNLAFDPRYEAVLEEMSDRLEEWMAATEDPLLTGDVPLPETGWQNLRELGHPAQFPRPPLG